MQFPPEKAAAGMNAVLVLILALVLAIAPLLSDDSAVAYASPFKHAAVTAAIMLAVALSVPAAGIVAWRTLVHGQRVIAHQANG